MLPELLTLSTANNNLLGGKTIGYFDASGKRVQSVNYVFEESQAHQVSAFVFKVDTELLISKLTAWHSSMKYGVKNLYYRNRPLIELLNPALQTIEREVIKLRQRNTTPAMAGEIVEQISVEFLRIKPAQDKVKAFLQWFKMNDLVDQYRDRYSVNQHV